MHAAIFTIALAGLAAAAPATTSASSSSETFTIQILVPDPRHGDSHVNFDSLFLAPYHTGAGLNDAGLFRVDPGFPATLANGNLHFDVGSGVSYNYQVDLTDSYKAFTSSAIDSGAPGPGAFFVNATGVQYDNPQFGGWLACEWWRKDPTVFTIIKGNDVNFVPSNCEFVELQAVGVKN